MKLNEIANKPGATKNPRRVGRGIGSGRGKTSGRGHKGQKSRSGVAIKGFEGGQMPIYRRLPRRGFKNLFRRSYDIVNLGTLEAAIEAGKIDAAKPVGAEELRRAGLIRGNRDGVRLLAGGEIRSKITIEVVGASKAAAAAVEKAGGKLMVSGPAPTASDAAKPKG